MDDKLWNTGIYDPENQSKIMSFDDGEQDALAQLKARVSEPRWLLRNARTEYV